MLIKQRGFALITVLLVAALVAIISSQLLGQQNAQIQRSGYMLHQAQALSVAWGLESWVKQGLKLDGQNNKTDHLNEVWAQALPPIAFEDGEISGVLLDAQANLNVNNLLLPVANPPQEGTSSAEQLWQQVFDRYAEQQGINQPLADVIGDWIDQDSEPRIRGAETDQYLLRQPAYRAANVLMVSTQEVLNLQGMSELDYAQQQRLIMHLSALPKSVPVNINTAPEAVLMALSDWMTPQLVQAWLSERLVTPADGLENFYQFLVQASGLTQAEITQALPQSLIAVRSEFFILHGRVDFGLAQQQVSALFYRDPENQVKLLQRWLSVPES
ncbi:type II secretion system protein K [Thiosulfatimonas sediminis]|uniref:Type II secretion system protein K n=1 Tax=Thiosulfatimonas sediminis TaxID=2675054 RepID=A0A6F8PSP7_9GAMM|nr:type II secretion system minor pseudopilin GspK [Thiosulfatimonas sediminis]BBP45054.1 type II secretion system protein K [Thiosulfatimonas sediminis]